MKRCRVFLAAVLLVIAFVSAAWPVQAFAAGTVKVETYYEIRDSSFYDKEDEAKHPVLYVHEFPVFSGPGAEKMAAAWAVKSDVEKSLEESQTIQSDAEIKKMKQFDRAKHPDITAWEFTDYLEKLTDKPEEMYFDIDSIIVGYDKNGILSLTNRSDWMMGGVHSVTLLKSHTFEAATGRELEITDVLKGSKAEILALLKKEFDEEFAEGLEGDPTYPVTFYLSEEGVCYSPSSDLVPPYMSEAVLTIPYSRKDVVKPPFSD